MCCDRFFKQAYMGSLCPALLLDTGLLPIPVSFCENALVCLAGEYKAQGQLSRDVADIDYATTVTDDQSACGLVLVTDIWRTERLLSVTRDLGPRLQYNSPGFARNVRHHVWRRLSICCIHESVHSVSLALPLRKWRRRSGGPAKRSIPFPPLRALR
jgi:hypothetical protein